MKNDFYVYIHKRQSDGIVFYVGKGRGKRAYYFHERNDHWKKHSRSMAAQWRLLGAVFVSKKLLK